MISPLGPGSQFHAAKTAHESTTGKVTQMPRRRSAPQKVPYVYDPLPVTFYEWAPDLTKTEILVYLILLRKTRGFQKSSDMVSTSQLTESTRSSKSQVLRAISRLEELGLVLVTRSHRKLSFYEILTPRKVDPKL
jgi:DNA-binding transcriptional ArsR family regulator